MGEEDPNSTNATYRIMIPEDPSDDEVMIELIYRDITIKAQWRDSKREDLRDLLKKAGWFIDRTHIEFEVHRQATEIEGDLDALFPKKNEEESE